MKKRMRLPNGFGRITYIKSGNLRNRWRVMITVGHDLEGKPIGKLLKPTAYFKTYNDAYAALLEYNREPAQKAATITVEELFAEWFEKKRKECNPSYLRSIDSAWHYVTNIRNMRLSDIRTYMIKDEIENSEASKVTKTRMKSLFNIMFDYAVEYEYMQTNIARNFSLPTVEYNNSHIAFTDQEMEILWRNKTDPYVQLILIQCYMGWRPQELCELLVDNVHVKGERNRNYDDRLIGGFVVGGMKTSNGKDRHVPIHDSIVPLVESVLEDAKQLNSKYLVTCTDSDSYRNSSGIKMTYDKYKNRFDATIKRLGLNENHRPHDPRKQFITMCKKYNVNEYAIKRMVGHSISDITEKVYTERDPNWLYNELMKVKGEP